jgi:hypothetical protein
VDFREQATLVYANLKAATEGVGGKMEISPSLALFSLTSARTSDLSRGARQVCQCRGATASTTLEVSKLAREDALFGSGSNRGIARRADGDVVRGANRKLMKSIVAAAQPR